MPNDASPDHPIEELLVKRWSPCGFAARAVSRADLLSLLEAARWAASSYNEQPWRFIVATQESAREFERLLSCLVEGNQDWAKSVPVLALGVVGLQFSHNQKPNRVAIHDLGLAVGNLTVEATARGLVVHQMGGILPEKARELYKIPEGFEAVTGIAVGYEADPKQLSEELRKRDLGPRTRKPLRDFVFGGQWGESSSVVA
jgi:nitroreductase